MRESPAAAASQRFPVSLLTGFLGSGKTTVLNRLVNHPDMVRTVVIINEFGEIGLDHELVETAAEDTILLQSGCLCCSIRGDLIDTLRSLFMRRVQNEILQFDRVVIETTGLADPAPILHTLMTDPLIAARFRLGVVVMTVDAAIGSTTLDRQIESVKQAAGSLDGHAHGVTPVSTLMSSCSSCGSARCSMMFVSISRTWQSGML